MLLAENAGPKKSPNIRHRRIIAQICRAVSLQLRHVSTIEKKLVKQQYLAQVLLQYGARRFPALASRTKKYQSFINFGLLNYQ